MIHDVLMGDAVQLVGRDAGADRRRGRVDRPGGDPAGVADLLDLVLGVGVVAEVGRRRLHADIGRGLDPGGNREPG